MIKLPKLLLSAETVARIDYFADVTLRDAFDRWVLGVFDLVLPRVCDHRAAFDTCHKPEHDLCGGCGARMPHAMDRYRYTGDEPVFHPYQPASG